MENDLNVRFELAGWSLFFARLIRLSPSDGRLACLRRETVERVRAALTLDRLSSHPTVAAVRKLFRAAGCDPTRYRPSSEALLRRCLKGQELPAIDPLVDLNNCLSLALAVPCCVMAAETVKPPYVLRAGKVGEIYESLKGPFHLDRKPILVDALGPCDAPITGSRRVMISSASHEAWLVAYLPRDVVGPEAARTALESLLAEAPIAEIRRVAVF